MESKNRKRIKLAKRECRERLIVDKSKWGANENTYRLAPNYYYDIVYTCVDCGRQEIWKKERQKYFFEKIGGNTNSRAVRCRICSAHVQALKEEQKRHMAEMAKKKPHPHEAFFNKKY